MGLGNGSSLVFATLFCLTLFCFVTVRIYAVRHRYRDGNQQGSDIALILKSRMAQGEIDEKEYHRLKDLLTR
jgi:putative membrane protein